jgi:hypothetical protein
MKRHGSRWRSASHPRAVPYNGHTVTAKLRMTPAVTPTQTPLRIPRAILPAISVTAPFAVPVDARMMPVMPPKMAAKPALMAITVLRSPPSTTEGLVAELRLRGSLAHEPANINTIPTAAPARTRSINTTTTPTTDMASCWNTAISIDTSQIRPPRAAPASAVDTSFLRSGSCQRIPRTIPWTGVGDFLRMTTIPARAPTTAPKDAAPARAPTTAPKDAAPARTPNIPLANTTQNSTPATAPAAMAASAKRDIARESCHQARSGPRISCSRWPARNISHFSASSGFQRLSGPCRYAAGMNASNSRDSTAFLSASARFRNSIGSGRAINGSPREEL